MKVVNPNNSTHLIGVIPRYYGFTTSAVLTLKNEATKDETDVAYTSRMIDGVLELTFDFTFKEGDRFALAFVESNEVIYRGLLFATEQETQDFEITKNYYSYG